MKYSKPRSCGFLSFRVTYILSVSSVLFFALSNSIVRLSFILSLLPFHFTTIPYEMQDGRSCDHLVSYLSSFITSGLNGNVILNACSVTSSLSAGQVPPTVLGPLCPQYGFLHAKSPPPQNPQPTVCYSICTPDLFLTNPHPFPFPEGFYTLKEKVFFL